MQLANLGPPLNGKIEVSCSKLVKNEVIHRMISYIRFKVSA